MTSSKSLMHKLVLAFALTFLASSVTAEAQYPGRYPSGSGQYPPGQYPPGQGPMGGSGIPIPWGGKKSKDKKQESKQPTFSAEGQTVSNDGKQLVVETKDGRTITLAVTPQTKYVKGESGIQGDKVLPRTTVHVDAFEDGESNLTATKIELLKDAPAQEAEVKPSIRERDGAQRKPETQQPEADKEAIPDPTALGKAPDDPNRPMLRRGKPTAKGNTQRSEDRDD